MNQPTTSLARNHFLDALRGTAAAMVSAKGCPKPGQMYYVSACRLGRSLWQKLRQNPIQLLRPCQLPHQHHPPQPTMGVWLIAASLAVVVIDAQLASRSRLGEENRRCEEARTAAEERNRAAEATKRQGQGIALLRIAALLSARVQLDPSELNRSRLIAFLALLAEQALLDQLGQ